MLEQTGFVDVRIGPPVDTFGGAGGESKARLFEVSGYASLVVAVASLEVVVDAPPRSGQPNTTS